MGQRLTGESDLLIQNHYLFLLLQPPSKSAEGADPGQWPGS